MDEREFRNNVIGLLVTIVVVLVILTFVVGMGGFEIVRWLERIEGR